MREILFRGKRLDNGEWVQGTYYRQTEFYGTPQEKHFIITSTETLGDDGALEYFEVDPATVGQFTGLTDKNGKRIFEGDVVVATNRRRLSNKPYEVVYDPLSAYWQCAPAREPVIVGNVHDNPDLVEWEV